jgi:Tetratricopeptide repeat
VLGADHPDTLTTRHNIAFWTGECGDAAQALRLFRALLLDRERVLGADHPDTFKTRDRIRICENETRRSDRAPSSTRSYPPLLD